MEVKDTVRPEDLPVIGITLGDVNGIGPEIVLKTLAHGHWTRQARIVVYGQAGILSKYKKTLNKEDPQFEEIKSVSDLTGRKVGLINIGESYQVEPGTPTVASGQLAADFLHAAVADLKAGHLHGVVTAPIHKANMPAATFPYPGHTELFATEFGNGKGLMMLVSDDLRIAVATGHMPLAEVASTLTQKKLEETILLFLKSLKNDFGILKPTLAVLGLNPHAGEQGKLGSEDQELIAPVITKLREAGHLVYGPLPADGFFGAGGFKKHDGVLAMYHDQGLIPFKTLAFESGVNYTAGLSIVRTSPDHGTAFDLAGKGRASHSSMTQALAAAIDILSTRQHQRLALPRL